MVNLPNNFLGGVTLFNNKKIAAGLAAACLPLMMVAISVPAASANTGVSSEVDAIDRCAWVLGGFSSDLTLLTAGGAKYQGVALSVSSTITGLTLGLSGYLAPEGAASGGTSTECSFYNAKKQGQAEFKLATADTFTASYGTSNTADTDMDFSLAEGGGLGVEADVSGCTDFTSNDAAFTAINDLEEIFLKSTVDNIYGGGAAPKCSPDILVSTTIPASAGAPAGAGQDYSFTGPELTITLRTPDVAG